MKGKKRENWVLLKGFDHNLCFINLKRKLITKHSYLKLVSAIFLTLSIHLV